MLGNDKAPRANMQCDTLSEHATTSRGYKCWERSYCNQMTTELSTPKCCGGSQDMPSLDKSEDGTEHHD
jgi:hypothetical protein